MFDKILNVLRLVPTLLDVVKAVEASIPVPQAGKDKLNLILDIVKAAAGDVSSILSQQALADVIGLIVTVFNKFGIFKKS